MHDLTGVRYVITIKIIKNETTLGIAASLNKGIIESSGDWIVRMDDDDESLPDRLEKQINFLRKNSDVDIFGSKAIFQNLHGKVIKDFISHWPPTDKKEIEKLFYAMTPLIHPTVCMRKKSIIDTSKEICHLFTVNQR